MIASSSVTPVSPPPEITLTLTLSIEEAKLLRAALGNQGVGLHGVFLHALKTACYWPPSYPNANMACDMCLQIGAELEGALDEAGEPAISGTVM